MKNNDKALATFMENISDIHERLDELKIYFDNHMEESPDSIHWGHVGDAGLFLERLTELTDRAFKRGGYETE